MTMVFRLNSPQRGAGPTIDVSHIERASGDDDVPRFSLEWPAVGWVAAYVLALAVFLPAAVIGEYAIALAGWTGMFAAVYKLAALTE